MTRYQEIQETTSSIVAMTQRIPSLGCVDSAASNDIEAPKNLSDFFHNGISNFITTYKVMQTRNFQEFVEETKSVNNT